MEQAAVLVRRPAAVPRDVRRDQPKHSLPLETELATSSTARQEQFALTRRHDAAERAHHAGDVLCLSAVTIRGLVHEWLDAEAHDLRPSEWWVRRLLHGMRLSNKKPAKRERAPRP